MMGSVVRIPGIHILYFSHRWDGSLMLQDSSRCEGLAVVAEDPAHRI